MKRYNIVTHPKLADITWERRALTMTKHASMRAIEKNIIVPQSVEILAGDVVELETENGSLTKLVVRKKVSTKHHLVLVLVPSKQAANSWTVVTCWLNAADDNHGTLDKSRLSA